MEIFITVFSKLTKHSNKTYLRSLSKEVLNMVMSYKGINVAPVKLYNISLFVTMHCKCFCCWQYTIDILYRGILQSHFYDYYTASMAIQPTSLVWYGQLDSDFLTKTNSCLCVSKNFTFFSYIHPNVCVKFSWLLR